MEVSLQGYSLTREHRHTYVHKTQRVNLFGTWAYILIPRCLTGLVSHLNSRSDGCPVTVLWGAFSESVTGALLPRCWSEPLMFINDRPGCHCLRVLCWCVFMLLHQPLFLPASFFVRRLTLCNLTRAISANLRTSRCKGFCSSSKPVFPLSCSATC